MKRFNLFNLYKACHLASVAGSANKPQSGQTYQSADTLTANAWSKKGLKMSIEPGFSLEYNIVIDVPL